MAKVKLAPCPAKEKKCACYKSGNCLALENTDFGEKRCPFYKHEKQAESEWLACIERLLKLGKSDEALRCLEKGWEQEGWADE